MSIGAEGVGLSDAESGQPAADNAGSSGDPSRPVTISHIAASAGVSIPTVSKVLNGRSGVSAHTRARVEALVNQYGYRKPPPAIRRNIMELVFDDLEHMWGVEVIRGAQRVANQHRLGLVLTEFGPHRSAFRHWIDDAVARHPACIVSVAQLSEGQRNQLRARGIPRSILDPIHELPDEVPFVGTTNWAGGRSATRHLIGLGHRRIAMIGGPDRMLSCRARLDGYRSALESAGLRVDATLLVQTELTTAHGRAATQDLLSRPDRLTAVFAGNDLLALGVYQAAQAAGLRIPADPSVVGFDDLPISAMVDPPLTTIHQPLTEMAVAASELALALGSGRRTPQVGIELATTITIRASTAPPP